MKTSKDLTSSSYFLLEEFNKLEKHEDKIEYLRSKTLEELESFKSNLEKKIKTPILVKHFDGENTISKEEYLKEMQEKIELVRKVIWEYAERSFI